MEINQHVMSGYVINGWYRLYVRKDKRVGFHRTVDKLQRQFERETGKRPYIMSSGDYAFYYVEFWTQDEAAIWKLSNADHFIDGEV